MFEITHNVIKITFNYEMNIFVGHDMMNGCNK